MKERKAENHIIKKILSTLMIVAILSPYCVYNTVKAKDMEPLGNGYYNLYADSEFSISVTDIFRDGVSVADYYAVPDMENYKGASKSLFNPAYQSYNISNRNYYVIGKITIDENVDLMINTKYGNKVQIQRMYSRTGAADNGIPVEINNAIRIPANTYLNYDYLHQLDDQYGQEDFYDPHYLMKIIEDNNKWEEFEIRIRRNSICVYDENSQDATINNDVMYVKPSREIKVINAFKLQEINEGKSYTGERSRGTFTEDSASIITLSGQTGITTIKTAQVVGNRGTLYWSNNAGTSCSIPVKVSNLVSSYLKSVNGQENAKVQANENTEIWQSLGSVYVKRNVYASGTSPSYINIYPDSIINGASADVDLANIEVVDLTGCLATKQLYSKGDHVQLLFVPSKEGVISVRWKDYAGNIKSENWKVQLITKAELKQKVDIQSRQDIEEGAAEKAQSTNGQEKAESKIVGRTGSTSQPVDTGSQQTNPSYNQQNKVYKSPGIYMTSTTYDSETVKFNVTTSGATDAMYQIKKRTQYSNGNLSEYEKPSSTYSQNGGWGASNPSSYSFTLSADEFGEGYFDVTSIARNTSDTATSWVAMGPFRLLKQPKISYTMTRNGDESVTYNFTTQNATNAKLVVRQRTVNADGSLGEYQDIGSDYSQVQGTEQKNPSKFSITLKAPTYKRGYYDVSVIAKNTDDDVTDYVAIGPNYVNATPIVGITTTYANKSNKKSFATYCTDLDKDKCDVYYYIQKKDSSSTYVKPSKETIMSKGVKNSSSFELDVDKDGVGYYDISVLAIDPAGAYDIEYLSNVPISNAPTMVYQIEGEEGNSSDGYVSSTVSRNVQKIKVDITDADENDNVSVYYYVSDKDLDEKEVFKNNESFYKNGSGTKYKNLNGNSGTIDIDITADDGKLSDKYLYMLIEDKYGAASYYKAGAFSVDDTPLELTGMTVVNPNAAKDDDTEKTKYAVGDELKVMFQFNHTMSEKSPDLYIKLGDSERKQDRIEYNENTITYVYEVKETDNSGYVSLSRLDYSAGEFEDNYTKKNKYNKQINTSAENSDAMGDKSNVLNCVETQKYYVDTVAPEITDLKIELTTDESTKQINDTVNNKIYLSNVSDAKVTLMYNEKVIGQALTLEIIRGNNQTIWLNSEASDEREQDEYSLIDVIQKIENYEGAFKASKISGIVTVTDLAGNKAKTDNYKVSYILNGNTISNDTEIIVDKDVQKGKITKNIYDGIRTADETERNNVYTDDSFYVGTIINCFTEFVNDNEQDYKDASEIKSFELNIYDNNDSIELLDKNGNIISKNSVNSDDSSYTKLAKYTLTSNQLPVSFELKDAGKYRIVTIKEDNLGNKSSNDVSISVTNALSIDLQKSGLKNIDNDNLYNIYEMTDSDKEYTIYIKNDSGISLDNIQVLISNKNRASMEVEYVEDETIDGASYNKYKFKIIGGGEYKIEVRNRDTDAILLQKSVDVDNVYMPGDTNNDGRITVIDSGNILRYLAHIINTKYIGKAADLDGDGTVDVRDAVLLCRVVAEDKNVIKNDKGYYTTR